MNSLQGYEQIVLAGLRPHSCRHCQQIRITSAKPLDEQEFFFWYKDVLKAKNDGCDFFSTQISSLQRLRGKYMMYQYKLQLLQLKIRIRSDENKKFHYIAFDWLANGRDLFNSVDEEPELHVFALKDSLAAHHVTARPLNPNPKSAETMNLVRHWLHQCYSRHSMCRDARESLPARGMPCRLIAVGAPGDINIYLEELNENSQEAYMALTYCWGGYPTEVTSIDNLPERKRNLNLASLSATIKDAVIVTRELGCKYLWVDALCIVQDNDEERERELSKMAQIYSRALLTISAAKAEHADEGFLQERDIGQAYGRLFKLPFCSPNQSDEMGSIILHEQSVHNDEDEPIDLRAWTMQERYVSLRSIRYGSRQIEWKCQQGGANDIDGGCDCRGTVVDESSFTGRPWDRVRGKTDFDFGNWIQLVEQYSRRHLSNPDDRLPAFAALAENFAYVNKLEGSKYRAGLWEVNFPRQLLWCRDGEEKHNSDSNNPPTIQASWSWASLNRPIEFIYSTYDIWGVTLEVVDFNIQLKNQAFEYGTVEQGHLIVKGYLKEIQWTGRSFKSCGSDKRGGTPKDLPIEAVWDSDQTKTRKLVSCLEVNAESNTRQSHGILLVCNSLKTFKRVGYFKFDHQKMQLEKGRNRRQDETGVSAEKSSNWNWFWVSELQMVNIV
ncbi:uncharacterized protein PAC_09282 [Phialocephala subalpina]|uniref:Heterokaryon incompatibility domain-containing protein n=1 Tax=Phialocephala subalpina TaxID=576137 RepID=A0A1L7X2Y2_9HELO|nr:uncharacterized protein PAC_09282 [Phialocephala subalpina]